jgi:hypothetical protein
VIFYVGLHQPSDAQHFERCMVSVNRLRGRRSDFEVDRWIMDSGAFTEVTQHGGFRTPPEDYAAQVDRWSRCGKLEAAVTQDWMCEPWVLEITGCTVEEHQARTVDRYDRIRAAIKSDAYLMPVLQGFQPQEYVQHLAMYGERLGVGAWVGVGSVCKRNSSVAEIEDVFSAIAENRADLQLHGFGIKTTALTSGVVCDLLSTADSMAWSYSARKQGRDGNDWREAARFVQRIESQPRQLHLWR